MTSRKASDIEVAVFHSSSPACVATIAALRQHRIPYREFPADAKKAAMAGYTKLPVVIFYIAHEVQRGWSGYEPDQVALLGDLIDVGPVPREGLDSEDLARDAVLTQRQAFRIVRAHQIDPQDFRQETGDRALYRGSIVLDWLGY